MDSNDGPIKQYMVAKEAKRKRPEEEDVVPLIRKKCKVSQVQKETAEDEEQRNAE